MMQLTGIRTALKAYDQRVKETKGRAVVASEVDAEKAHIQMPGARICVPCHVDPDHVAEVDWEDTFKRRTATPDLLKLPKGLFGQDAPVLYDPSGKVASK